MSLTAVIRVMVSDFGREFLMSVLFLVSSLR